MSLLKATRDASSMQTWRNSHPTPRPLLWRCDAVADPLELAEFFDIDVDLLAGPFALVAAGRLGQLQSAHLLRRDADGSGDLLAGHALTTEALETVDHRLRCRLAQSVGPRASVLQAGQAFLLEAADSFGECQIDCVRAIRG
jgi:hypothetical protein